MDINHDLIVSNHSSCCAPNFRRGNGNTPNVSHPHCVGASQVLTLNCLCHATQTHTQSLGLLNLSTSVNCDDNIQKPNAGERNKERMKRPKGAPLSGLPTDCVSLSLLNGFTALRLWQHINWRRETYKIKRKTSERKRQLAKKENNNKTRTRRESRNGQKSTSNAKEIRWKGKRKSHPQHE